LLEISYFLFKNNKYYIVKFKNSDSYKILLLQANAVNDYDQAKVLGELEDYQCDVAKIFKERLE